MINDYIFSDLAAIIRDDDLSNSLDLPVYECNRLVFLVVFQFKRILDLNQF